MTTAIERLEAMLDDKDAEIEKLQAERAKREYGDQWGWMRQRVSDEKEGLPVPRLEIRWQRREWDWLAEYSLVTRSFFGEVIIHPLGVTRSVGGIARVHAGVVDTPVRENAHIRHDMRHLSLPGFAICEDTITKLEPLAGSAPYGAVATSSSANGAERVR